MMNWIADMTAGEIALLREDYETGWPLLEPLASSDFKLTSSA